MANQEVRHSQTVWWTALLALLLCAACTQVNTIYQQNVARWRKPGMVQVESPERTRRRYDAGTPQRDALIVEVAEALPERALPGEEINHRIRYACLTNVPSGVRGRVIRRVMYRGKAVFEDITECRFVPGTWNVDAFIRIPRSAPAGPYAIEAEVRYGKKSIRRATTFVVKQGG